MSYVLAIISAETSSLSAAERVLYEVAFGCQAGEGAQATVSVA
jgi:hypothetical protein